MIAEDRSRYAIRPFESAQGRLLLEVYPAALVRELKLNGDEERPDRILDALGALPAWPVEVPNALRGICVNNRHALDAVIAARCAAVAVLNGEANRRHDELDTDRGDQVRLEGSSPTGRNSRADPSRSWQGRQESNLQPPVLETGALPIELLP